jgi:hypothetical protein
LRAGYGEVGNQAIEIMLVSLFDEARHGPNQNVYFPDFLIFIIMWVLLMI